MHQRETDQLDALDRVFTRLKSVPPPPDLTERILAALPAAPPITPRLQVAQTRHVRVRWGWVTGIAAVFLLIFSLRLGMQLEDTGALSVIGAIFEDLQAFWQAPGAYFGAITAGMPWGDLLLALGALGIFWYGGGVAAKRSTAAQIP